MMTPEQILKIAKPFILQDIDMNNVIYEESICDFAKSIQAQCVSGEAEQLTIALNKMKALPRFSFLSPKEGGVKRYADKSGNWIEHYEAVKILDDLIYELPPDQLRKIKELEEMLEMNSNEVLFEQQERLIKMVDELKKQNDVMRKSICIYSREMLGNIDWQSDEQAINYMLSFTEENPHGDESIATVGVNDVQPKRM